MLLRLSPLFLFASCGLFGLSQEDADALTRHQRNASTYYEGNRFSQAMDQVRRGLEIAPDDYKLHVIRGWCLLRLAQNDPQRLPEARAQFDKILSLRGTDEQGPQARLGYGVIYGRIGLERLRRAEQLTEDLAQNRIPGQNVESSKREVKRQTEMAARDFERAESELRALVHEGDQLLEAHYHLMYISVWRDAYDSAVEHGNAYLLRVAELQDDIRANLERTLQADYERELRIRLQNRIDEELEVRAFLANLHFKNGHHELVVEQLEQVLLKNPRLYHEYFNRGRSLAALGRRSEAERDFEKFLATTQLSRENPQVREALDFLSPR